jgi:lyso-ornithine lipid O-acyltransferase
MAYLRAVFLFIVVMFFYAAVGPLQRLALRRRWPLSLWIPTFFHGCLLAILRIRVVVHDRPAGPPPKLIVSNHVSWTDICALSTFIPVCFLSKIEVAGWPIVSTFARLQRSIFVDRRQPRSIVGANATIVARMRDDLCVVLFPEGTTFDGSALGHFHSSHFAAARDYLRGAAASETFCVQPLAIRYSAKHIAWYGDAELLPHLMTLLKQPPARCDIYFCAPIAMRHDADRKALAEACNKAIDARLAAPQETDKREEAAAEPAR